jgi:butyrate kinase
MVRILVINPGSTSTKVAAYEFIDGDELPLFIQTLRHSAQEIAQYPHIADQYAFRRDAVLQLLNERGISLQSLDAVVGRGGILKPIPSGTYRVNETMLEEMRHPVEREHASNLGCIIANEIAERVGVPAFIVDPVSVDEFQPLARISGLPEIERRSLSHALNLKATCRRAAKDLGKPYQALNLIGVHLGGGISVSAHRKGQMIDVNQALDGTGPFSPERVGGLPIGDVVRMCYSVPPYEDVCLTYDQMFKKLVGKGGLVAHLGTNDGAEIEKRVQAGDEHARLILEAMAYQIAKEIGLMATVLKGEVHAIVLTGGLAHNDTLNDWIVERTAWIAPVLIYAGEDEMLALAQGAWRVLSGEEDAKTYAQAKKPVAEALARQSLTVGPVSGSNGVTAFPEARSQPSDRTVNGGGKHMKKILCIEDELQMIDLIKLILESKGYQVLGAEGGQQGLEMMRAEKPDLILLDLMMPEMDGGDVFRHMKEEINLRDIPVVVVTAKAAPIDKVLWMNVAKVQDYVTKPFGPSDLVQSVEKVLAEYAQSDP